LSIQNKILAILLPLGILLAFHMGSFTQRKTREAYSREFHYPLHNLTPELAASIQKKDSQGLKKQLGLYIRRNLAIYASVMDSQGKVIENASEGSSLPPTADETEKSIFKKSFEGYEPIERFFTQGTTPVVDVWLPLIPPRASQAIGVLRLGFPLAETLAAEKAFAKNLRNRTAFLFILFVAVFLLYLRYLLRPVELLKKSRMTNSAS
jgi:hypothetical protein